MNYAGIKYCDIANGTGCRTVLFVSGCRNHCKGCFQPETWDFSYGKPFDESVQKEIMDSLEPDYIQGLTLLGGDPFEPETQKALVPFMESMRKCYPDKNVWAYTGYVLDKDLIPGGRVYTECTKPLLETIDILVDGPYVEAEHSIMLKFRGSRNQRVIDLKQTLSQNTIVLAMD